MASPLESLIACGTKLWLDSVDPELVRLNRSRGATGATSNPIIISNLIKSGHYGAQLDRLLAAEGMTGEEGGVAIGRPGGPYRAGGIPTGVAGDARRRRLRELRTRSAAGGSRLPAIAGGADRAVRRAGQAVGGRAQEPHDQGASHAGRAGGARGVVRSGRDAQRDADLHDAPVRGGPRGRVGAAPSGGDSLEAFKSVYSIFVSRVDVYTQKHVPELSPAAQGEVGIVGAKRLWLSNQEYWARPAHPAPPRDHLRQHGHEDAGRPAVEVRRGAGPAAISRRNPPATNEAVEASGRVFHRRVGQLPPAEVLAEIDGKVDVSRLEDQLMREGGGQVRRPAEGAAGADRPEAARRGQLVMADGHWQLGVAAAGGGRGGGCPARGARPLWRRCGGRMGEKSLTLGRCRDETGQLVRWPARGSSGAATCARIIVCPLSIHRTARMPVATHRRAYPS